MALSIILGSVFSADFSADAAETDHVIAAEELSDSDFSADSESDRQKIPDLEKNLTDKLDLRDYNGMNYVTPVKLQDPHGTCWAFAMAAAAEISYLYENDMGVPAGQVNDQVDFSEKYISWYMHHAITEDDVQVGTIPASQIGEGYDVSDGEKQNPNFAYDLAGNPLYGVNFYGSGFGPVDESTEINGEKPFVYAGKNRWRSFDPDVTAIRRYDCKVIDLSDTALLAADVDFDDEASIVDATWIQRSVIDMSTPDVIGKTLLCRIEE